MSVRGTYKGVRFRSLMELSFMLMKEREGRVVGDTLQYEIIRIKYRLSPKGRERTYVVDFFDAVTLVAYEVKPRRRRNTKTNLAKARAAEETLLAEGIEYRIVDEGSIPPLSRRDAEKIPGVVITRRRRRKS